MFARIAVWGPMSEDDRRRVVLAAKSIAGVRDAYHLMDPGTGTGCHLPSSMTRFDVSEVKAAIAGRGRRMRSAR